MAKSKDSYIIKIHYPETEAGMTEIRKRMGVEYTKFVKDYILTLPLSDEEKNELYAKVIKYLSNNYKRI